MSGPFQMQSWDATKPGKAGKRGRPDMPPQGPWRWVPMEDGAGGGRIWGPKATAEEAVAKCTEWTGGIFIPSMQVVDLATGTVVWRGVNRFDQERDDPGEPILLDPAGAGRLF